MTRLSWATFVLTALFSSACGPPAWKPPPPSGVTYEYGYQGYAERKTAAFGGVAPVAPAAGVAYGGAFNFRQKHEVHRETGADPFAQAVPIDGVRFNEHLAGRGTKLEPAVTAP